MKMLSIGLRGLLNVKTKERLFWDHTQLLSGITASFSGGGKNLVDEEIRAEAVLLKDSRKSCSSAQGLPLNPLLLKVSTC